MISSERSRLLRTKALKRVVDCTLPSSTTTITCTKINNRLECRVENFSNKRFLDYFLNSLQPLWSWENCNNLNIILIIIYNNKLTLRFIQPKILIKAFLEVSNSMWTNERLRRLRHRQGSLDIFSSALVYTENVIT